ncbi:NUDIX domain-containing protein [Cohnella lupini]|uniref:ADP-ribose pyrophosphatase n=1 Tax=Cohnella lupini TaxID=1294267 RepID=A0A3D9IIT0_9BACL|nr:NUDIX hydrolase [Cohnella lupini]RED61615.1 ADP-ribose pyrophosphatase [Cohnella lupini]
MSDNNSGQNHPFYEATLETKPIFQGRMISLQVDTVRLPNGETATREIVRHPGAVAVIAIIDNKMLVVEQFRKALEKVQVEIPAGKLDAFEEPEAAAFRELEEETGYRAKNLVHLHSFSTSPGFAEEIVHLYYTDDLEKGEVQLDDEEFLTCEAISLDQAQDYIKQGRICDAKTLLAVYAWRMLVLTGTF